MIDRWIASTERRRLGVRPEDRAIDRLAKLGARGRSLAAGVAAVALLAGLPPAALAEEEEGIWTRWASEVTDREHAAEIPIAIVFTIPPMIVITPFWLASAAVEQIVPEE